MSPRLEFAENALHEYELDASESIPLERHSERLANQKCAEPFGENKWCSWCQVKTFHSICKDHSGPGRTVRTCSNCNGKTVKCMFPNCKAMARVQATWCDNLCVVHDGTLHSWPTGHGKGTESTTGMNLHRKWCSWCFEQCDHTLRQSNILKRNVYQCKSCAKRTLKCRKCTTAMTRGHSGWDDELCAHCDKTITEWTRSVESMNRRHKVSWCSWCFCRTRHEHVQSNIVGRDVFACVNCEGRTLPCVRCRNGMARGDLGWDEFVCARCPSLVKVPKAKKSSWEWDDMSDRNRTIFAAQRVHTADLNSVFSQTSEYRTLAKQQGLERPFLMLVTMDPVIRWAVGCLVGTTYFAEEYFGDPHAESWNVLKSVTQHASTALSIEAMTWEATLSKVLKSALGVSEECKSPIAMENAFITKLAQLLPTSIMEPVAALVNEAVLESSFLGCSPHMSSLQSFCYSMRLAGIQSHDIPYALLASWSAHFSCSKDATCPFLPPVPPSTLEFVCTGCVMPSTPLSALPAARVEVPKECCKHLSYSDDEADSYTEDDHITSEYITTSGSDHDDLLMSTLDGKLSPLATLRWLRMVIEESDGSKVNTDASGIERRLLFAIVLLLHQKMTLSAQGFHLVEFE